MRYLLAIFLLSVAPASLAAQCKGRVIVEWTNNRQDDPLVTRLLEQAEREARADGYCVDHLDIYDSLGNFNRGAYAMSLEIKGSPISIFQVQSIPITKRRSIIVSEMRWQRGYWPPAASAMLGKDVHASDFDVDDFDASEMNAGEPEGVAGYANRIENAADYLKVLFKEPK